MSVRVGVIGAGAWGTTLAAIAAQNAPTLLWSRRSELAKEIHFEHRNSDYLPQFTLPDSLGASSSIGEVASSADVLVMAVPSHGYRAVASEAARYLRPDVPVVSVTKGLEHESLQRMSEVTSEEMPGHPIAVLTGPNLAKEVLAGQPAASVVATEDQALASELQRLFSQPSLRVYRNNDLVGCETGGVVKNIIAIAAGIAEGMGMGDNARAALLTRGLAEMTRLGVALGGDARTFSGLAGVGDLMVTCSSKQSRNYTLGLELGRGRTVAEVVEEMTTVAEGLRSSLGVAELARRNGIYMPITEQVMAVCHQGRAATDALAALMKPSAGTEFN